jgi:hypothetical protein
MKYALGTVRLLVGCRANSLRAGTKAGYCLCIDVGSSKVVKGLCDLCAMFVDECARDISWARAMQLKGEVGCVAQSPCLEFNEIETFIVFLYSPKDYHSG